MGLYEHYGTSKELEENGAWVDFGNGVLLLLARIKSQRSLAAKRAAERPYRDVLRTASRLGKEVAEDIQTKIALDWLATGVVLDWKEVTDQNGKTMRCNPKNARKLFQDLPDFLDDVILAASSQSIYQEKAMRDAEGNSPATSGGS